MSRSPKKSLLERMLRHMEITETCWLWIGGKNRKGYGCIRNDMGVTGIAHRLMYAKLVGEIPEGMVLDHECRVHNCVNPDHLTPVSWRDNSIFNSNSVAAINIKKTHCHKGHEFTQDNLDVYKAKAGWRMCLKCKKDTDRRYNLRKKGHNIPFLSRKFSHETK